jgi:hypothetical protein
MASRESEPSEQQAGERKGSREAGIATKPSSAGERERRGISSDRYVSLSERKESASNM